jgi:N-acetylneuraminic acid mutarotase
MVMKRRRIILTFMMIGISLIQSCDESDDSSDEIGNWVRVAPLEGSPRSGAVTFSIGEEAYVGLGYGNDSQYFNNFYSYNTSTGTWRRIKDFPGIGRELAVGFSLNGKGYLGLGYNRKTTDKEFSDFWKYDPTTDEWIQLNDFPDARYNSVAFANEAQAYVGAGFDGTDVRGDFWEYDEDGDTWKSITTNPGDKKEAAFVFTIRNKAYYGGGYNNGSYSDDFWEFDMETRKWTNLTPDDEEDYYDEFFAAMSRSNAVSFSLNNLGYVVGGNDGSYSSLVYEYDPASGEWTSKTGFEGSSRTQSVSFSINGRAFVGSGFNGSRRTDDFYEFKPFDEYDEQD